LLNNVLLVSALATVFIGTFYPLVIDAIGNDKISVGAPYFALTFVPLVIPLLVVMTIGPLLRWRADGIASALKSLRGPLIVACLAAILAIALKGKAGVLGAAGIALGVWVAAGSVMILLRRTRAGTLPLSESLKLAATLPRATYGVVVAHLGMGLLIIGIAGAEAWKGESVIAMREGETTQFAGSTLTLQGVKRELGPGYESRRADFTMSTAGGAPRSLAPELRFYSARQMQTTEAAIRSGPLGNLYVSIAEPDDTGRWTVRLYFHPLILWIWIGAALMAAGGFLSLSSGRLLASLRRRSRVTPRPHAIPAE
jgi:cytochrome c-type biogenesis protein CcmF